MKSLTDIEKLEIVNLYKSGLDSVQISKMYNRTPPAIRELLKRRGIVMNTRRPHNKKFSYAENYFENIDSEDKAYFLGFLYADGCNKTNRNTVTLFLMEEDKYVLEYLNSLITPNKSLSFEKGRKNKKDLYGIRIHNNKISKDLERLGVVKAKTHKLVFPSFLGKDVIHHFIRGYFDGDGHIGYSTNKKGYIKDKINIVGTESFLKGIELEINNIGVNCSWYTRHPERNHNIRTLDISGRTQVVKVMEYLYRDCNIKMDRKFKKFMEIKNRKSWKERI